MSAGAMAFAAQCMRQAQRNMNSYLDTRAAWRQARFSSHHRDGPNVHQPPERVDFPCFHLCSDCGFLVDEPPGACPACEATVWYDLAVETTAHDLRDMEELNRQRSPAWIKATLAAALAPLVLAVAALSGFSVLIILVALTLSIPIYALLLRPATVLLLRLSKQWPHRWHLPMPLPMASAAPARRVTGTIRPRGEPLRSPFSGRQCVAYQLSILFDVAGDARPPEWVVQETRGTDFEVDGEQIRGDRVLVTTPLKPVEAEVAEAAGLDLTRFLRERGLFSYDGSFDLFEACLVEGEQVETAIYADLEVAEVCTRG